MFVQPLYCGVLFDQGMLLNRRKDDFEDLKGVDEKVTHNNGHVRLHAYAIYCEFYDFTNDSYQRKCWLFFFYTAAKF